MKINFKTIPIVLAGMLLILNSALADELTLENGDRITGKVVRMEGGKLVLKTDYTGEINIDWNKVVYMKIDEPLPVLLKDGSRRQGQAFVREGAAGKISTDMEEAPMAVDVAEIKEINAKPTPTVKITAKANAGFSSEKGNTDTQKLNFDAEFIARTTKHRLTIGGEMNREDADSEPTSRDWRAIGEYDYFIKEKWFLYGNTFFENDDFADLELRSTYGAGVGHQFFESKKLNLSTAAGVAYVTENFIVAQDDEFPAAQWVIRYDQFFFGDFLQLFHDNNGYISLEEGDNWLINTRQGFRFPLYKGFVMTLQYNYDYNNQPSSEAKSKWDSKFLLLLGYQFEN